MSTAMCALRGGRILAVGFGLLSIAADLCAAGGPTWRGAWENRFEGARIAWVFVLPDAQGDVAGTLSAGDAILEVNGRREGPWLELTWKDAEGRTTQIRGVVSGASWRGTSISGGGGRLVEYGRFSLVRE